MGVVTARNVVAQVEGLLAIAAELCGNFPKEIKAIDPRAWVQALAYGKDALGPYMDSDLIRRLHEAQRHPDWEYESTECAYKGGYEKQPEGKGWIANEEKDGGCTRSDPVEYQHWRRLKTDALKDDITISHLPAIAQKKMKVAEYLGLLREKFNKGYMPSATTNREFNSKPEYVDSPLKISNLYNGNDVYSLETISAFSGGEDYVSEFTKQTGDAHFFRDESHKSTLIYGIEVSGFKILTNLGNDNTYITVQRKDGTWQDWSKWYDFSELPIDRFQLNEILDMF